MPSSSFLRARYCATTQPRNSTQCHTASRRSPIDYAVCIRNITRHHRTHHNTQHLAAHTATTQPRNITQYHRTHPQHLRSIHVDLASTRSTPRNPPNNTARKDCKELILLSFKSRYPSHQFSLQFYFQKQKVVFTIFLIHFLLYKRKQF